MKYLGVLIGAGGRSGPEVAARLQAINKNWLLFGGFWFQRGVPKSLKRLIFITRIYSTALSAATATRHSQADYRRLNTALVGKLRRMLGSKGVHADAVDTGDYTNFKAMKAADVWRSWKLLPVQAELLVLRLGWYQQMLLHRAEHQQVLTAFCGNYATTVALTRRAESRRRPIHSRSGSSMI